MFQANPRWPGVPGPDKRGDPPATTLRHQRPPVLRRPLALHRRRTAAAVKCFLRDSGQDRRTLANPQHPGAAGGHRQQGVRWQAGQPAWQIGTLAASSSFASTSARAHNTHLRNPGMVVAAVAAMTHRACITTRRSADTRPLVASRCPAGRL